MYKRKFLRKWGRPFLLVLHWLAIVSSVLTGAVVKIDLEPSKGALIYSTNINSGTSPGFQPGAIFSESINHEKNRKSEGNQSPVPEILRPHLKKVQGSGFWFLPLCTIIAAVSLALRSALLPPTTEKAVKALLDDFRNNAFPTFGDERQYRVTLFRHCWSWAPRLAWLEWKMPWHGWLVPFERSGIFTLNTKIRFFAPLDAPTQCEGFAGSVYASGDCKYLCNLPEIKANSPPPSINDYSNSTCVTPDWIKKRLKKQQSFPRSLWGIPIEVSGNRWGVLVVDSLNPRIKDHEELKEKFKTIGLCLNRLLSSNQG